MHEISPVLSGRFEPADYQPTRVNFTTAGSAAASTSAAADTTAPAPTVATATTADSSSTSSVDSRRYTKFDRTASNAGTDTTFSFGDFLDMINPLQHIPVASSVYREATGESINPVARVAGDMLYGGIFGLASVAMSGVGAIGDSMMETQTGKDAIGYVTAALFGDDAKKAGDEAVQVAAADTSKTAAPKTDVPVQTATVQISASAPAPQIATATIPQNFLAPDNAAPHLAALNNPASPDSAKSFALDRNKLPYGGVMAPVGNMQDQNMIMALSQASHSMRLGNTVYTGKMVNGPHPLPVASGSTETAAATTVTLAVPVSSPAAAVTPPMSLPRDATTASSAGDKAGPQKNPIPQNLIDDMVMLKSLDQYNNLATGAPRAGSNLDITN